MSRSSRVVWSEGMFLQPQHFQQHDRYLESRFSYILNALGDYNWGFSELKIDGSLLSLGKFSLLSCKGIFPDGTVFNVPAEDEAPLTLEVPINIRDKLIYLAVPLPRAGTAETQFSTNEDNNSRYRAMMYEVSDSNALIDSVAQLQVGKLSLRLMLENENLGGYAYLPIARIAETLADKSIILDEQFIPSTLNVHAIARLSTFIKEVYTLLHSRGEVLAQQSIDVGTDGLAEVSDFILLQTINRYEYVFRHLATISSVHPERLFQNLIQMLGDISTFRSNNRRLTNVPVYQHTDLDKTFSPVISSLRASLSEVLLQRAVAIDLEQREYGLWVGLLKDKSLLDSANFILSIRAEVTVEQLHASVMSTLKIAAIEKIQSLISHALPGIKLENLPVLPRYIPYTAGCSYFALQKNSEFWEELTVSTGIALHVGTKISGLEMKLWAIRSNH